MPPLTVFSCGTGPLQPSPALLGKLAEAQSIYASSALLEACPPSDARRIPIGKNAREQAREALEEARHGNNVVVLASGDAQFHGIGGTLQSLACDGAREECAPTSMLLLLPDERSGAAPILPLGLPADFYEKENNLITAEEVRAVILSKLRLPAWGVLWDVGAGSGSIGLEAAALRPGLSVYGLERQASRLELIRRNCRKLGCVNYACMQGEAPEALAALPAPDRVFLGGGGAALESIMQACFDALNPGGLLVASAVTTESEHLLYGWNAAARTGMFSLDIASESPIAGTYHHLRHGNRITLFTYSRA